MVLVFIVLTAPLRAVVQVELVGAVLSISMNDAGDQSTLQRDGDNYIVAGTGLIPVFTAVADVSSIDVQGPGREFLVKKGTLVEGREGVVAAKLNVDDSVEETRIEGRIGGFLVPAGPVTIGSARIFLNAGIETGNNNRLQRYDGDVILGVNTTLSAGEGSVSFLRGLEPGNDDARRLVVFASGGTFFNGVVGSAERPFGVVRIERSPVRFAAGREVHFGLVDDGGHAGFTQLDFDIGEGQELFDGTIDGAFIFHLPPDAEAGTVWPVVNGFQPVYGDAFTVNDFEDVGDGNWRRAVGDKIWFFSERFGLLRVAPAAADEVAGRYQGVLTDLARAQFQGSLDLRVDSRGRYTGQVTVDGQIFRGRGEVVEGAIRGPWESKGVLLNLDLYWDAAEGLYAFRGDAESGGTRWNIEAGRANFDNRNPLPEGLAGPCTAQFIIGAVFPAGAPVYGSGFATGSFRSNGGARLAGRLPDGTRFTASAPVWGGTVERGGEPEFRGYLRFCVPLYRGDGFFGADFLLEGGNPAEWEGDQSWRSPAFRNVNDENNTYLSGSLAGYKKPARGQSALPSWPEVGGVRRGEASFTIAGADVIARVTLALDARNRLTVPGDNPAGLQLSFNAAKGTVRGRFRDPASGRPVRFEGTADQRSGLLTGYFLTPEASGLFMAGGAP